MAGAFKLVNSILKLVLRRQIVQEEIDVKEASTRQFEVEGVGVPEFEELSVGSSSNLVILQENLSLLGVNVDLIVSLGETNSDEVPGVSLQRSPVDCNRLTTVDHDSTVSDDDFVILFVVLVEVSVKMDVLVQVVVNVEPGRETVSIRSEGLVHLGGEQEENRLIFSVDAHRGQTLGDADTCGLAVAIRSGLGPVITLSAGVSADLAEVVALGRSIISELLQIRFVREVVQEVEVVDLEGDHKRLLIVVEDDLAVLIHDVLDCTVISR